MRKDDEEYEEFFYISQRKNEENHLPLTTTQTRTFTAVMREPPPFRRYSFGLLLHRPAAVNEIMAIKCLEKDEKEREEEEEEEEEEEIDDDGRGFHWCRLWCHRFDLGIFKIVRFYRNSYTLGAQKINISKQTTL